MESEIFDALKSIGVVHAKLETPKNLDFGDLAITLAKDAKELNIKLPELGEKAKLALSKVLPNVSFHQIGPFLNIKFERKDFAKFVLSEIDSSSYLQYPKQKTKIMVEFSQPNTHKEFHIGHLRNVSIGDAISRTLKKGNFDVIPVNYFGDVGTHVAKCLWAYDKAGQPSIPETKACKFFAKFYKDGYLAYEDNEEVKKEVGKILTDIEHRKDPWFALWKKTAEMCLKDFHEIYKYLGVNFQEYFYESECDQMGQKLVDEYMAKGTFVESEGAIVCDLNDKDLGVCLVRKSDGTSLYATKDLALAKIKFERFHIDQSLYVVGSEQRRHFQQVFETLKKMGFKQAEKCVHLSYELVMTPQGKMASRAGNSISLEYVQGKVEESVIQEFKNRGMNVSAETSRIIVNAALKYGMLAQDYKKRIIFDLEGWLKFEGDTGLYLLYTYARMKSILRKVGSIDYKNAYDLIEDAEREFLHTLWSYKGAFETVLKTFEINKLTNIAFEMAKAFNRFYLLCPVSGASDEIKKSRIHLLQAFDKVFSHCLDCLNIEKLEEM